MRKFNNYKKRAGFNIPKEYEGIIRYAQKDPQLFICLRGNEIHIYYQGGKILDLEAKKLTFDTKYLKIDSLPPEPELEWLKSFTTNDVIKSPENFFTDAKRAMDQWFEKHPKQERKDQQSIAEKNQSCLREDELAVIDIEYAVSSISNCYNKDYKDTFRKYKRYPNPRFDLIAIDKKGQLYVLELKTGLDSTQNCKTHITDFVAMIGSQRRGDNPNMNQKRWETFANEINEMIAELNKNKYRNESLPSVNLYLPPIFRFAFIIESAPKNKQHTYEYQKNEIQNIVRKSIEDAIATSDSLKLGNDVQTLFNKGYIQENIMYVDNNNFRLLK